MKDALEAALGAPVARAVLLPGGASKEAWAVDTEDGRELLVRRAAGGVIHERTLSLEHEFEVLGAAHEAGVRVPEPIAYLGQIEGREAFVMERVRGETIGRRIVKSAPARLATEMAQELARIHAIPRERLPFLRDTDPFDVFYDELDSIEEPHPAIELGLHWARERIPLERPRLVGHGDFRLGNLAVDESGLVAVLDWEFAHVCDPAEDVAWPLVRAWRFGRDDLRLGGISQVEPYLEHYAELTGREIPLEELYAWEVLGNCKWAIGALRQGRRHLRGEDRSVEFAILGRLAAEMEYEVLDLIRRAPSRSRAASAPTGRSPAPRPPLGSATESDRPNARELVAAVREFLEQEILPTLDDHRLRFRTLVAMNALSIVERESPEPGPPDDEDRELARRLRAGDVREQDLVTISYKVRERLRIASPAYLDRYDEDDEGK